jgi:hypothetical protein
LGGEEIELRFLHIVPFIFALMFLMALGGCGSGQGTLADYFGWQSLGGTWYGTLHFTDGTDTPLTMTFTEFDGDSVHVSVEAGEGPGYIRNEADAEYTTQTKRFTFQLNPFFGGPCLVDGTVADKYIIHGNMEIQLNPTPRHGYYDLTFPH